MSTIEQFGELAETAYDELHLDGYIALLGPRIFGRELRAYLGLDDA